MNAKYFFLVIIIFFISHTCTAQVKPHEPSPVAKAYFHQISEYKSRDFFWSING